MFSIDDLLKLSPKPYYSYVINIIFPFKDFSILYKAYSLISNNINDLGESLIICKHSSEPMEPPAPVTKIFLFFIFRYYVL